MRRKGVFVLELQAVVDKKAKGKSSKREAMDIEEVEGDGESGTEEGTESVEEVGAGLWFRKARSDNRQGFTRQA